MRHGIVSSDLNRVSEKKMRGKKVRELELTHERNAVLWLWRFASNNFDVYTDANVCISTSHRFVVGFFFVFVFHTPPNPLYQLPICCLFDGV